MNRDRRIIAPFLGKWFPELKNATSDEIHHFLDRVTGLETPMNTPNGEAFDRWREKLAGIGYPVFKHSPDDIAAMKDKAEKMLEAEQARAASLGKTLVELAKEAPNWTAAEVLASTKARR